MKRSLRDQVNKFLAKNPTWIGPLAFPEVDVHEEISCGERQKTGKSCQECCDSFGDFSFCRLSL